MRIGLGSDHAGFELKEAISRHLTALHHEIRDYGTNSKESVDYPDYARSVAEAVASGEVDYGILVCWTGIGMSIAANKMPGIRAALCSTRDQACLTREHNDANVLCLGQREIDSDAALPIVAAFLETGFAGGRHEQRVKKIADLEQVRLLVDISS